MEECAMKALTYIERGKFELIKNQAAVHGCPDGTLRARRCSIP